MKWLIQTLYARAGRKTKIAVLIASNVLLIVAAIFMAAAYYGHIERKQLQSEVDAFCATMESMKQITSNHLQMERQHVLDWASYIERQNMTMEQALMYIREENAQPDRMIHILDIDTYEAYSTDFQNGSNRIDSYRYLKYLDMDAGYQFNENIRKSQEESAPQTYLFGRYRVPEAQITVISVGARLTLQEGEEKCDNYLLLRLIPVESMTSIWVFPEDYRSAEVGIITDDGDYVVQSPGMKSVNFIEFIRAYNYADDYNGVEELVTRLSLQSQGLLQYKNSEGQNCYWYYSKYEDNPHLCIIGSIPVESLQKQDHTWQILIIICVVFFLLIFIDGYYAMRINRKLRKAYMMAEQANEAQTRFLSAMSHDIRTPMNAIVGMTGIAGQHLNEPAYVKECLDKVKMASSHLMTLINDILDVSKYESGKVKLHPSPFHMVRSMNNLLIMIQQDVDKKGLHLQVQMEELPYPWVIGDEVRMNQIWMNLLTNAVKYTPAGGTVRVEMKESDFREAERKLRLTFIISDTGTGMTPEFQKVMYDAFAREADSRIDKISGSGLGLAIVKQMVDLMDGTIECDSTPGVGTTFTVQMVLEIPDRQVTGEQQDEQQAAEESPDAFRGMRVLVAEDNDLNWKIIHIILNQYGVESDRVENGKACVEMALQSSENTYNLILMDVQMPVMNGKEATQQIRNSGRKDLEKIVIYAMTADAYAEDIQACLDAGMDGHIAKPIDVKHVRAALNRARKQRQ